MGFSDIDKAAMRDLPGVKEGFAADAWLANWDVIGNGPPEALNLKRTRQGRAFRLDFGGCLQYHATGGKKPFAADNVPELESLKKYKVFSDITDDDIAAAVAKIAALSDSMIRRLVAECLGDNAGDTARILIGRKNFLQRKYLRRENAKRTAEVLHGPEC